ncbi:hypothetical protein FCV25MIE_07976 [Fagus crenata]
MVPDIRERTLIDSQLEAFKEAKGLFGIEPAKLARKSKTPAQWWDSYGDDCPELQKFAIKILSLTCSSSGCERNWSAFDMIKDKRVNPSAARREISIEDLSSDDDWLATEDVGDVGDDHDDDDDLFDRVAQHSPCNLIDEDDEGTNLQL